MIKWSVPCPVCGSLQIIDSELLEICYKSSQLMCWDECGMDVFVNPMYVFLNKREVE